MWRHPSRTFLAHQSAAEQPHVLCDLQLHVGLAAWPADVDCLRHRQQGVEEAVALTLCLNAAGGAEELRSCAENETLEAAKQQESATNTTTVSCTRMQEEE